MVLRLARLQDFGAHQLIEESVRDTCSKHCIQHQSDNLSCCRHSGERSVQQAVLRVRWVGDGKKVGGMDSGGKLSGWEGW